MRIPSLCIALLIAAGAAAAEAPWTESFSMILKDKDRTFVIYGGATYLVMVPDDANDAAFLAGKDVMLEAKFERAEGGRAFFYRYDLITVIGAPEFWSAKLDGDNVYLFGRFASGGEPKLVVDKLVSAPSDGEIIELKLKLIAKTDYAARIEVAAWTRHAAPDQGNREFWMHTADEIATQVVRDILETTAKSHDPALLRKAFEWSLDLISDKKVAAEVASVTWLGDSGDLPDHIADCMRKADFVRYNGSWLPHLEAVQAEFDQRFEAIKWRDAEGYYKLGRWVESQSDILVNARELAHRCYQAGFRADEKHNGIRHELGLARSTGASSGDMSTSDHRYKDQSSGIGLTGPQGWSVGKPIDGDITWVDPESETAYVSARVQARANLDSGFDELWNAQKTALKTKNGFIELDDSEIPFTGGQARRMHYSFVEGRYVRYGDVIVAAHPPSAIILQSSCSDTERSAVQKAFDRVFASISIPAP